MSQKRAKKIRKLAQKAYDMLEPKHKIMFTLKEYLKGLKKTLKERK